MIQHCRLTVILLSVLLFSTTPSPVAAQGYVIPHGFASRYPGALTVGLSAGPTALFGSGGPTGSCNCEYDGGSGMGYSAGIVLDVYLNNALGLRLQSLYEGHSTAFTKSMTRELYSMDGSPVTATSERRFESDLQYASISMHMLWFTGAGNLFLSLGAGAGFYIDGTALDQETLTTPGVFYQNGSNRAVYHDGDLDDIADPALRAAVIVGLGYDLPLARGLALAPEVQFELPLSSVTTQDSDWKQMAIRFSAVLRLGI